MKRTCTFLLLAGALLAAPQLGPKDGRGLPPADLNRIQVGHAAPDFTLQAADGRQVTLSGYRGKQNVILVFYRGQW
jgi:cytochrome oxidase Cu insertion factor (SCO1/SenC/PrrC family)